MTHMKLNVEGMTCGGCVRRLQAGLGQLAGVKVDDAGIGFVSLSFDPDQTTTTKIEQKIAELGFTTTIAPRPVSH